MQCVLKPTETNKEPKNELTKEKEIRDEPKNEKLKKELKKLHIEPKNEKIKNDIKNDIKNEKRKKIHYIYRTCVILNINKRPIKKQKINHILK